MSNGDTSFLRGHFYFSSSVIFIRFIIEDEDITQKRVCKL